jgi:DNA-binding response OmpR family regulator
VSDPTERDEQDAAATLATIFVVEDDADLGLVLLRFLEEEVPCRVVLSPNGFEAMKLVRSITPQLFLLDYHLPGINGLELVDSLRAIPGLEQSPMILMSARMPPDGLEQRQLLAIHKPFDFNTLIRMVRALI